MLISDYFVVPHFPSAPMRCHHYELSREWYYGNEVSQERYQGDYVSV